MSAPIGNQFATKSRLWRQAIERALGNRSRVDQVEALDALAEKLLARCDEGDMAALKELGDRLDGKPAQSVTVAGDEERPLIHKVVREIVRATDKDG